MDMGGGGGAGGYVAGSGTLNAGTYTITVGAGGAGAPAGCSNGQACDHMFNIRATSGGSSVFNSMTAQGGGYGGSSYWGYTPDYGYGGNGGSGGGASGYVGGVAGDGGRFGSSTQSTLGYGNGNRGGGGYNSYYAAGGGGAGAAGGQGVSVNGGGIGIVNAILGTSYYWAGGGGGASYQTTGGPGGNGGGGGAAVGTTGTGGAGFNAGSAGTNGCTHCWAQVPGGDAGANTGGGGGGGSHYNRSNKGGNGGSGIVVVRVQVNSGADTTVKASAYNYLQLVSNSIDTGTNAQTVTATGSLTYVAIGGKTGAYFPNSLNVYLNFPFSRPNSMTMAFWYYAIDAGYYTMVSVTQGSWNPTVQFDTISSTSVNVYVALPNQWVPVGGATGGNTGRWVHCAFTVDYQRFLQQFYVDGTLIQTTAGSGVPSIAQDRIVIGRSGDNGRAFNGYIRHFTYFQNVLTAASITSLRAETA